MNKLTEITNQTGCIPEVDTAQYIEIITEVATTDDEYVTKQSTFDVTKEDQLAAAIKILKFVHDLYPAIFERSGLLKLANKVDEDGGFEEGTEIALFFDCVPNDALMLSHTLESITARYFDNGTVTNLKFKD